MLYFPDLKDIIDSYTSWRTYGDFTSIMLIAGAFAEWLPHVAAALSVIWLLIRIYETDTVQRLIYGRLPWDKWPKN